MKPIKITEEFKAQALEAFQKALAEYSATDGALSFKMSPSIVNTDGVEKPIIRITTSAYMKMMGLVLEFDGEICWHGLVERLSPSEFRIYDILCYPQKENTGTHCEMDEDKYALWNMQLEDAVINAIHFQGHSHVNMSVSPSGTDTKNWDDFLKATAPESYWIFCIANKKNDINWWIFDLATNWIYEPKDVTAFIETADGLDIKEWTTKSIKDNMPKPKEKSSNITNFSTGYTGERGTLRNTFASGVGGYYGDRNYDSFSSYSEAWDEGLDEDDIETSETYKDGFRWSTLWKTYIRILPHTERLVKKSKNNATHTRNGRGGKKK